MWGGALSLLNCCSYPTHIFFHCLCISLSIYTNLQHMHKFTHTHTHHHFHCICSMGGVLKHRIPSCCSSLVSGRGMWEEGSGAVTGGAVKLDVGVLFAQVGHLRSHGVQLLHLLMTTIVNELIKWERINVICNVTSLWEQTDREHESVFRCFEARKGTF